MNFSFLYLLFIGGYCVRSQQALGTGELEGNSSNAHTNTNLSAIIDSLSENLIKYVRESLPKPVQVTVSRPPRISAPTIYSRIPSIKIVTSGYLCAKQRTYLKYSFGLNSNKKKYLMSTINESRSKTKAGNMNCLLWSEKLAARAARKAQTCLYDDKNKATVMAMVYERDVGTKIVSDAISRWTEEKSYFLYGADCSATNTCRFQQLIWAESKAMGCALQRCVDMSFLVCLFDPPGNVDGELPYVNGEPCTQCPAPPGRTPRCNTDNLCEWYFPRKKSKTSVKAP